MLDVWKRLQPRENLNFNHAQPHISDLHIELGAVASHMLNTGPMDNWPPPPPRPFSTLQTASDVDAIKDKLSHLMRTLDTVRNTLTAPLPEDILVHVFRALVDLHDVGQPLETRSQLYTHYGWIAVTHVCRAWRDLALGTSTLWTRIVSDRPQPAQAFLERSGREHLLDVWGQGRVPMEYLEKYAHRLRAVGWLFVGEESFCGQGGVLDLPNLQSLYLYAAETSPKLVQAEMPRLKRLSLGRSPWSLREALLRRCSTLTHLEIIEDSFSHGPTLPVSRLLDLLRCLPMLEELHLSNVVAQDALPSSRGVELPKLGKISLQHTRGHVNVVPCARLLASLVYPWTAAVELVGSQPGHTYSDCQEIVSLVLPRMLQDDTPACSAPPLPIDHLSVSCSSSPGSAVEVRFTLTRGRASSASPQGSLTLALSLNYQFEGPIWGRLRQGAPRWIDEMLLLLLSDTSSRLATGITHLTFNTGLFDPMPAQQVDVWTHLHSAGLPLVSLVLTQMPCRSAQVAALIDAMELALGRQEPFLPHLHTLWVPRILESPWKDLLDATLHHSRIDLYSRLIRVLWKRREHGFGPMFLGIGPEHWKEVDAIEVWEGRDKLTGVLTKRTRLKTGIPRE